MVILVKALLTLSCNCFKLFNYIYSLDTINDFFFDSLFLIIMYAYVVFSLFYDVSLLIFNRLFLFFFGTFYNTVDKLLVSRQRFLSLSFTISCYRKDSNLFIVF
jgi:hypothetical protein